MSPVKEIEAEIDNLPPDEFTQIVQWVRDRDQALWDMQMDADSAAGKLDFLFAEAQPDADASTLREWPASN